MNTLRVLAIIAAMVGGFVFFVERANAPSEATHIFSGLAGPDQKTAVPPMEPARWQKYEEGSDSRLAILLTQTKSNWLGLAHGLKSIGIPFSIMTDITSAIRHKVVLVYPTLPGAEGQQALGDFVRGGGTLIAFGNIHGMEGIFGIAGAEI